MPSLIPLQLLFKVMGDRAAISKVDQLGKSARSAGEAIKAGTAQAWSPMIGQLKKSEEEMRALSVAAKKSADDQVAAAKAATQAWRKGAEDQKDALKAVADQQKANALAAIQAAKDQQQVYKQAQTISNSAIQTAGRTQVNALPPVVTGNDADIKQITQAQQLSAAQQVGGALSGFFDSRAAAQAQGIGIAETRETQIAAIAALQGSQEKADQTYAEIDQLALKSVYDLTKLTEGGKTLAAAGIYSERNLKAADNVAAVGYNRGVTPEETAFALAQLKNGAPGRAFMELRRLGLNNSDFEAQGLKFSASNEYEGTPEQAVEGVVKAIEKKFGNLSEKLATGTTAGAEDQLDDARARYAGQIQGELLPAMRLEATALTTVTTMFANMPGPLKALAAYGGGAVITVGQIAGSLMSTAATAGQAMIALDMLRGSTTASGVASGVTAVEADALSVSLTTRLAPALASLASFVSITLPLAVAAGIALMIKARADSVQDDYEKRRAGPEAGTDLGSTGTREGALKNADDQERRAQEIDKNIEKDKAEKAISWPINLYTGTTPAQYQEQIDSEEKERDALLKSAEKLRKKAPSLPSASALPMIPATALLGAGGMVAPTAGDSFQVGPGVNPPFVGKSDMFTGQIRNLEDQKSALQGNVHKDERDAITLQIRSLRRQQQDARAAERDARKEERDRERTAKALGKRNDKVSGYEADVQAVKDEIADQDKIDDLQYRLDKAKDDSNADEVRALTLELEQEKARQRYAKARAEAAKAGITDAAKADSMNKIADLRLADETRKASVTADRAKQNVVDSGGKSKAKKSLSLTQIAALMSAMNGGMGSGVEANTLKPGGVGADPRFANLDQGYANGEIAWNQQRGYDVSTEVMRSLANGGQVGGGTRLGLGIPSAGDFTGADRRKANETARIARIKAQRTTANGKIRVDFEPIIIDDPDPFGGWNGDA